MLLIEEKSLDEVYQLYILSYLKKNHPYWTIAILETEFRLITYKAFKNIVENANKFHAENPYFKLKNAKEPFKEGEPIRKHL